MKILLTGSSGFIGRNVLEKLGSDYEISAPSRDELNLLNQQAVSDYLKEGKFDVIIHAANSNHVKHPEIIGKVIETDLRMYINLASNSDLFERMICFGSGAEYDSNNYISLMDEEYLGEHIPTDHYGFAKYISACLTVNSKNIYELCLFGVYGKYEEWKRRFISNVIYQCIYEKKITIEQHAMFDYIFIDDLIAILRWFINIDNRPKYRRYNVCSGKATDLFEIAQEIRRILECDKPIDIKKEGWKREYSGNNIRLLSEIGQFEFTRMDKAIGLLTEYYVNNGFVE